MSESSSAESAGGRQKKDEQSRKGNRTWSRWSEEEHALLTRLVEELGVNRSWSAIAAQIPGRTGKQCRERWLNHTSADTKKGNWSHKEEYILATEHSIHGSQWCRITRCLPGRTDNSVKNHWNATWRSKVMHKPQSILWLYSTEMKAGLSPPQALKAALVKWENNVPAHQVLDTLGFWPSQQYGGAKHPPPMLPPTMQLPAAMLTEQAQDMAGIIDASQLAGLKPDAMQAGLGQGPAGAMMMDAAGSEGSVLNTLHHQLLLQHQLQQLQHLQQESLPQQPVQAVLQQPQQLEERGSAGTSMSNVGLDTLMPPPSGAPHLQPVAPGSNQAGPWGPYTQLMMDKDGNIQLVQLPAATGHTTTTQPPVGSPVGAGGQVSISQQRVHQVLPTTAAAANGNQTTTGSQLSQQPTTASDAQPGGQKTPRNSHMSTATPAATTQGEGMATSQGAPAAPSIVYADFNQAQQLGGLLAQAQAQVQALPQQVVINGQRLQVIQAVPQQLIQQLTQPHQQESLPAAMLAPANLSLGLGGSLQGLQLPVAPQSVSPQVTWSIGPNGQLMATTTAPTPAPAAPSLAGLPAGMTLNVSGDWATAGNLGGGAGQQIIIMQGGNNNTNGLRGVAQVVQLPNGAQVLQQPNTIVQLPGGGQLPLSLPAAQGNQLPLSFIQQQLGGQLVTLPSNMNMLPGVQQQQVVLPAAEPPATMASQQQQGLQAHVQQVENASDAQEASSRMQQQQQQAQQAQQQPSSGEPGSLLSARQSLQQPQQLPPQPQQQVQQVTSLNAAALAGLGGVPLLVQGPAGLTVLSQDGMPAAQGGAAAPGLTLLNAQQLNANSTPVGLSAEGQVIWQQASAGAGAGNMQQVLLPGGGLGGQGDAAGAGAGAPRTITLSSDPAQQQALLKQLLAQQGYNIVVQ